MKSRKQLKAVADDLIRGMQLTERNAKDEKVPIVITDEMESKEIEEFIKTAKTKPWFDNTIFVMVADHCAGIGRLIEAISKIIRLKGGLNQP